MEPARIDSAAAWAIWMATSPSRGGVRLTPVPEDEPNECVDLGAEGAFEPLDELVVARAGWTDPRLGRGHRRAGVDASPEGVERAEDLEPDVLASPIATQTAHRGGSSRLRTNTAKAESTSP
jgi:hypothetical protein